MNKLTTDLKSLHEATLNNLKSSKANNTLRAYKSDFKDFGAFCAKYGLNSLPSEPKIVSLYLTHLSKNSKISTLRRRLVSIGMVHKLKGHYLDMKHPIITENLLGIKRVKGSFQKGKKRSPRRNKYHYFRSNGDSANSPGAHKSSGKEGNSDRRIWRTEDPYSYPSRC